MFVDIHNHLLPAIDDGARSMAETVEMARAAAKAGTDIMAATPHRTSPIPVMRRSAPPAWIRGLVYEVNAELSKREIGLTVVAGVEIPLAPSVADDLVEGRLMTFADNGVWALIEPPFDRLQSNAAEMMEDIRDAGFSIVLAHPERNAVVQRDFAFLEQCAALGVCFQITTGSILGHFGAAPLRAAEAILRRAADWKIVIASDMHDLDDRPPTWMGAARDAAARIVGDAEADRMVDDRPRAILAAKREHA